MFHRLARISQLSYLLAASFLLLVLAGCEDKGAAPPSGSPEASGAPQPSAAALAALAKADAIDGKADKVVSKCLTCSLGMDGSPEHVAKVGEYQLHLCSDDCKAAFEKAPEKALLAVKIPE